MHNSVLGSRLTWLEADPSSTHGSYRPTLPKLISQNDANLVKSRTWAALRNPNPTDTASHPQRIAPFKDAPFKVSAFNELIKNFKGVGPATATLILSVGHPDDVPFFSDELYAWLTQSEQKAKDLKLRYNQSEYHDLVEKWNIFRLRYQTFGRAKAYELEKVAYVLDNWDLLSEDVKEEIEAAASKGSSMESQDKEVEARREEEEKVDKAQLRADLLEVYAEGDESWFEDSAQRMHQRDPDHPPAKYVKAGSKAATLLERDVTKGKIPNMEPSDAALVSSLSKRPAEEKDEDAPKAERKSNDAAKTGKKRKGNEKATNGEEPERRRSKRAKK